MGNSQISLTPEKMNSLTKDTDIKPKDIKKIHKKFTSLDKDSKGYVSMNDFSKIPEIEKNPLFNYIGMHLADQTKNDEVDFENFMKMIDIFKNNKTNEQYKFLFELFDYNKDGKICHEDLLVNLKPLLGGSLNGEQIREIVEKTIQEYSSDQKYILYDEFVKILE